MIKEEIYIYLFIILLMLFASCFLCSKHMGKNRGNFVNLPAWKKATKSILDILMSSIGICVFLYYKLFKALGISAIVPLLLALLVFIMYIIYKKTVEKSPNSNILFGFDAQTNNRVLNIDVIEYVIYGFRYVSKAILYLLICTIGSYKIVRNIWAIETAPEDSYLSRLISYISNTISNDFSVYLIGIFLFSVLYSSLVMVIFSITLDGEGNYQENQQKYFNIRRKFHFKEHSI